MLHNINFLCKLIYFNALISTKNYHSCNTFFLTVCQSCFEIIKRLFHLHYFKKGYTRFFQELSEIGQLQIIKNRVIILSY